MVDLFVRKMGAMLFLKQVSGEDNSNTAEMIAPWKNTTIPTILSKYKFMKVTM